MYMKDKKSYNNINVLLIEGRARQVMPLMESLHDLGCHVTTYNSSKLDMGYASHFPNKKILSFCDAKDPEKSWLSIRRELETNNYDLVIPLNDFVAIILSKHKMELKEFTDIAVNDWEIFQYASDKLKTMKICMENDIPCPKTYLCEELTNSNNIGIEYPICIKPRTGFSAVGFRRINSKKEYNEIVPQSIKKYGLCLIQEYIPQTDKQYKAELYIDNNGELKSACVFAKVRWYPIDGGSSTLNVTVHRKDIVENCMRLLKAIKWRGYADVDLIQDPRDDIAKIMEINPRITGSVKICYKCGINFSKQILDDYLKQDVTPYLDYPEGIYLRYIHTDILWFLKSSNRFSFRPSWFNFKKNIDQIWSWRDPWPFFTYSLQGLLKLKNDKEKRSL